MKKCILSIFLFTSLQLLAQAVKTESRPQPEYINNDDQAKQDKKPEINNADVNNNFDSISRNIIYNTVGLHVQPEFPGGIQEFLNFIYSVVEVPQSSTEVEIKVIVSFIVETNGILTDVKVVRDPGFGMSKEIERVVSLSPKWSPGIKDNIAVRVRYFFPIPLRFGGKSEAKPENHIYTIMEVDEKPQYGEGVEKYMKLFSKKFTLPRNIQKGGKFMVPVVVIVEEDGSLTGANVLANGENGIAEEMKRVIPLLPKWNPAEKDGKPVRCRMIFTIPLVIKEIESLQMKNFTTP